jgi:ATP-binding cassette subfamily C protein
MKAEENVKHNVQKSPVTPHPHQTGSEMPARENAFSLIRFFVRAYPGRSLAMVAALVFGGVAEGLGVISLLPLLALVSSGTTSGVAGGALYDVVQRTHQFFGLSMSVGSLLLLTVSALFIKAMAVLVAMRQVGYTVAHVVTDFRLELVRALFGARWEHFIQQPAGRFANAYGSESERAVLAYYSMAQFLSLFIQVGLYIGITLMLSWETSIAAIFVGSLMVVGFSRLLRVAKKMGGAQTRLLNSLVSRLTESLNGMKAIKAMGREHAVGPMLAQETQELNKVLRRQVVTREMLSTLQEPFIVVFLAIGIYGAVTWWEMPFSSLMVMAILYYRVVSRIASMQRILHNFSIAESAFWSLRRAIVAANNVAEPSTGKPAGELRKGVEFREVSFRHQGKKILDRVSFSLAARQLIVISGRSGVGKTTLFDLILGLYAPQEGEILIDGTPLKELDLKSWRHQVGYVPQETLLFNDTVYRNVCLGDSSISAHQVRNALEVAGAWEFVESLPSGVDTYLGEKGLKLSGGQRQRIALARDVETELEVVTAIRRLTNKMTVLVVSHQPAFAEVADRRYELHSGKVSLSSIPHPEMAAASRRAREDLQ